MTAAPDPSAFYDELLTSYEATLTARPHAMGFFDWFQKQGAEALASGRHDADLLFVVWGSRSTSTETKKGQSG